MTITYELDLSKSNIAGFSELVLAVLEQLMCIFRREKSTCTEKQVHLHGGLVHFHKEDIEQRLVTMSLLLSDALPRRQGVSKKSLSRGGQTFFGASP